MPSISLPQRAPKTQFFNQSTTLTQCNTRACSPLLMKPRREVLTQYQRDLERVGDDECFFVGIGRAAA